MFVLCSDSKMASLDDLTDSELRTQLTKLGYPCGPITTTTRKVLLKKLKLLLETSKSDGGPKSHKNLSRFSSGDESEDDAKPQSRKSMPPPKKTPPVKTTRRRSSGRASNSQQLNDTISSISQASTSPSNGVVNSTPEKEKYSPTFSESYLKGKRSSSVYNSISGRRSYRSDIENTKTSYTYDTGSDTDVNDGDASSANFSNIVNQNRFSRGDDSFSRSLGLSTGLTTSYVPADSFKHRSSGGKIANDEATSKLGNDGFEHTYASADISRRFARTGSSTFANRTSSSLPTSTLGLSNVKESDDEEPLRCSVSPSPYITKCRSDRWAFDSPWWRSTSIVSMGLLIVFVCFFAFIFILYVNAKWKDTESISTPDTQFPTCEGDYAKPGITCIVKDDIPIVYNIFRKMYHELYDHVVRVRCDGSGKVTMLKWAQLSQIVIEKNSEMSVWEIEQQEGNLKVLIEANPQWEIALIKDGLDIPNPSLPFVCLIKHNVIFFIWFIFRILLGGAMLYLMKLGVNWWMCRKEEHKKEVFKLVEGILDLLQTHSQNSGDRDTFLAMDHIRDQLIPPQRRNAMSKLWDDAVAYLECYESRVRSEVQQVAGEDCHVWRWLPTNNRRKMWQGQAFETQEGSVNSLSVSPTPCLKIRHMFDLDVEVGDEWMTHVKDAILEKCEGINVIHIAVDTSSSEGCVYLKCSSPEEAGKAFRALHGSWFDSKLVTVKYLRLGRYHERFPDAVRCVWPLRPSNNHKMSLQ